MEMVLVLHQKMMREVLHQMKGWMNVKIKYHTREDHSQV